MPTSNLDKIVAEWQKHLADKDAESAKELTRVFYAGYRVVREKLDKLDRQFKQAELEGLPDKQNWYYEHNRYEYLMYYVQFELEHFLPIALDRIEADTVGAVKAGSHYAQKLIELQLGDLKDYYRLDLKYPSHEMLMAMVGLNREESPLRRLFESILPDGAQAASDALVEGAMMGYNPRKIAPMLRDALGVQLTRALTISRTEMMRATRIAAEQTYYANSDVVEGWTWVAELDGITCPACLAQHGTFHPLSERLNSHPNCRCVASPQTYSWEDIGKRFGLDLGAVDGSGRGFDELKNKYGFSDKQVARYSRSNMTGEAHFKTLNDKRQREILGKTRYNAYKAGVLDWSLLTQKTYHPEWGEGIKLTPLSQLLTSEQIKEFQVKK